MRAELARTKLEDCLDGVVGLVVVVKAVEYWPSFLCVMLTPDASSAHFSLSERSCGRPRIMYLTASTYMPRPAESLPSDSSRLRAVVASVVPMAADSKSIPPLMPGFGRSVSTAAALDIHNCSGGGLGLLAGVAVPDAAIVVAVLSMELVLEADVLLVRCDAGVLARVSDFWLILRRTVLKSGTRDVKAVGSRE